MNDDIITPLAAGATALHENMAVLVSAGFTRDEAVKIVIAMLTEAIRNENGNREWKEGNDS